MQAVLFISEDHRLLAYIRAFIEECEADVRVSPIEEKGVIEIWVPGSRLVSGIQPVLVRIDQIGRKKRRTLSVGK